MKNMLYWIWNRRRYIKKPIIWILSLVLTIVLGLFVTKKYNYITSNKSSLILLQLDPMPADFYKNSIDFPYIIKNNGDTRVYNVRLKIIAPGGTKASRSPLLEFTSDYSDTLDIRNPVTFEYKCESLDPKETAIISLFINKTKYENDNNLPALKIGSKFSTKRILFPHFVYLKFDEGVGEISLKESLTYNSTVKVAAARGTLDNALENGYQNYPKLRVEYTLDLFGEIIRDSDRIFNELKNIKSVLDNSRGKFDWQYINRDYQLPELLFYDTLMKDSIIKRNSLASFDYFINISQLSLSAHRDAWSNDSLSKEEAYNRIKYYNNEVILARKILVAMITRLKGKVDEDNYKIGLRYFIKEKIRNDSLPLNNIGEITY